MKNIIAIACLSVILLSSCKKEDNCNLTEESLAGTYKLTALTYRPDPSSAEQDLFNALPDCEKDNLFVFYDDKNFEYMDMGISCLPSGHDVSQWHLIGTTLEFDGNVNKVLSFDCRTMVTTISNYHAPGDVYTATYIKQ